MTVLITQSNYIPWKGYFHNIAQADIFVIYDDMQYTKRDWRNRNKVKTEGGVKWLSIPVEVKGKYHQRINETKVSDPSWNEKHWSALQNHYRKAPYFKDHKDWIEALYRNCKTPWLTEINRFFIEAVMAKLDINTEIRDSREFKLKGDKTEKLVGVCEDLGATHYFTGPAAKNYMSEKPFKEKDISVIYADYSDYPEYDQIYPPFEHGVTIWDVFFHCPIRELDYLKEKSK